MKCAVVIQLWKCVLLLSLWLFSSTLPKYVPLLTFNLSPITSSTSPLNWHVASCIQWWRIENSTKLMVVCLLDRVLSVPQLYLLNTWEESFTFPKSEVPPVLLTHTCWGKILSCLVFRYWGVRHVALGGREFLDISTYTFAGILHFDWPSLIHTLTCLINCFSLVWRGWLEVHPHGCSFMF